MASSRSGRGLVCAAIACIAAGMSGAAFGKEPVAIPPSSAMLTGALTSQPIGHYEFCKANPEECSIRSVDLSPTEMTDALWTRLVRVDKAVNRSIKPMNDIDIYGRDEVWNYPADGRGDCEDYVLEKRRVLHRAGVPLSDLLITVVKKPDGEGHAVLTVRTSEGDFILDNLNDSVRRWEETGYRFLKRQAADNTGRWVSIRGGQATAVAAVKAVK
jgi:predicted transglutaminase-like cysteine proteinase